MMTSEQFLCLVIFALAGCFWEPVSAVSQPRYQLLGLRCGAQNLQSPTVLSGKNNNTPYGTDALCRENFTVEVRELRPALVEDDYVLVVVEHSSEPLPAANGSTPLLTAPVAPAVDLRGLQLPVNISRMCGTSFLIAYLQNSKKTILDFDTLPLRQPCADRPSLRLVIRTASPTAYPSLQAGSTNPFAALGLSDAVVENSCPASIGSCQNATDLRARWAWDSPEAVAFFLQMNYSEAANLLQQAGYDVDLVMGSSLQTKLGIWLQSNALAYDRLLQTFVGNLSTFSRPQFLHNTSLLMVNSSHNNNAGAVPLGGELGRVNLEAMRLPAHAAGYGFLVLALDPLNQLADVNRTDNIFVQFVNVSNSLTWLDVGKLDGRTSFTCSVSALSSGKDALIQYAPMGTAPKGLIYRGKSRGLKPLKVGKQLSASQLEQQLAQVMFSKSIQIRTTLLANILKQRTRVIKPMAGYIGQLLRLAETNIQQLAAGQQDAQAVARLLKVIIGMVDLMANDTVISEVMMQALRRSVGSQMSQGRGDGGGQGFSFGGGSNASFNVPVISGFGGLMFETTKFPFQGQSISQTPFFGFKMNTTSGSGGPMFETTKLAFQKQTTSEGPGNGNAPGSGNGNTLGLGSSKPPGQGGNGNPPGQGRNTTSGSGGPMFETTKLTFQKQTTSEGPGNGNSPGSGNGNTLELGSSKPPGQGGNGNPPGQGRNTTSGSGRPMFETTTPAFQKQITSQGSSFGYNKTMALSNHSGQGNSNFLGPGNGNPQISGGNGNPPGPGNGISPGSGNDNTLGLGSSKPPGQGGNSNSQGPGNGSSLRPITFNFTSEINQKVAQNSTDPLLSKGNSNPLTPIGINNGTFPISENILPIIMNMTSGGMNKVARNFTDPILAKGNSSPPLFFGGLGPTTTTTNMPLLQLNGPNGNLTMNLTSGIISNLFGNLTKFNAFISTLNKSSLLDDTEGDEMRLWDIDSGELDRRKRQVLGMLDSLGTSAMPHLGFVKLSAVTLQGFLMLAADHNEEKDDDDDDDDDDKVPFMAREVANCFQQIIWAPDDQPTGLLCSRLQLSFRKDLRSLLLMVAREELPSSLNSLRMDQLIRLLKSSFNATIVRAGGLVVPLTTGDVSSFMDMLGKGIKDMIAASGNDAGQQAAWSLVNTVFSAFNTDQARQLLADLAARVQGGMMKREGLPFLGGIPMREPPPQDLGLAFATNILSSVSGRRRSKLAPGIPTLWKNIHSKITKVEYCQLTGKWYATPVVSCACADKKVGNRSSTRPTEGKNDKRQRGRQPGD